MLGLRRDDEGYRRKNWCMFAMSAPASRQTNRSAFLRQRVTILFFSFSFLLTYQAHLLCCWLTELYLLPSKLNSPLAANASFIPVCVTLALGVGRLFHFQYCQLVFAMSVNLKSGRKNRQGWILYMGISDFHTNMCLKLWYIFLCRQ